MMNVEDFLRIADSFTEVPTIYMLGGFGKILDPKVIENACINYSYNKNRYKMYKAALASGKTYHAFDCSGLIKGILWGATPDTAPVYASNNVKDLNAAGLEKICHGLTNNMDDLKPGMLLFMPGHVGIYAGFNKVIECTPKWENKVQYTWLRERDWRKAGYLSYIHYSTDEVPKDIELKIFVTVRKGDTLTKIAKRSNITVEEILFLNPQIKNADLIHPGEKVRVK